MLAGVGAPVAPVGEQVVRRGGRVRRHCLQRSLDPTADRVLLGEVLGRRLDHGGRRWRSPTRCHSRQPAIAQVEDRGPFRLQLLRQVAIRLSRLEGERDQVQAPADGVVDVAQARLVIAGDEQLELRPVGEEVLAHEPGRDRIAAGQRLDPRLGPAPARLGLLRGDQPGAAQHRHVGRVAIGVAGGEAVHRGNGGVIAKDRCHRVQEHALAVAAGAVTRRTARARGRIRSGSSRSRVADRPGARRRRR